MGVFPNNDAANEQRNWDHGRNHQLLHEVVFGLAEEKLFEVLFVFGIDEAVKYAKFSFEVGNNNRVGHIYEYQIY